MNIKNVVYMRACMCLCVCVCVGGGGLHGLDGQTAAES